MRWFFGCVVLVNLMYWFFNDYMVVATPSNQSVDTIRHKEFVRSVELLSEAVDPDVSSAARKTSAINTQAVEQINKICWMVGPFKEIVSVKQVLGRLEALDLNYIAEQREVKAASDYWVYVSVQPSRKLAVKLLKELQIKKIDSFLISEGELKNGISLGLFSDKKRASNLLQLRKKQGYDVHLKEVTRMFNETWLVSAADSENEISEEFWAVLKKEYKTLEKRKFFCNSVASTENLD